MQVTTLAQSCPSAEEPPLSLAQLSAPSPPAVALPLTQPSDSSVLTHVHEAQQIITLCQQAVGHVKRWSVLSKYERSRLIPALERVMTRVLKYADDKGAARQDAANKPVC